MPDTNHKNDYLNFELQILELSDDSRERKAGFYRVQVVQSPIKGEQPLPVQDFTLPYSIEQLQPILDILSGVRNPRHGTREEVARQFGEMLFQTIFTAAVFVAYKEALTFAEGQDNIGLRLRLDLSRAGDLSRLPWEFLRDPAADYLALSRSSPLVRHSKQVIRPSRLSLARPLRILVMISAPEDQPKVNEKAERENIEKATKNLRDRGLVEIEYLENASLLELQRMLRRGDFHVFHYIGHGAFNPRTGLGMLASEDPITHKKTSLVRGEMLARELHEEEGIRLVVLNSCQGAKGSSHNPFAGVASSLVQRGIPAVVAQQFEISDDAAIIFSEEFYRVIAEGYPLEAAVSEA